MNRKKSLTTEIHSIKFTVYVKIVFIASMMFLISCKNSSDNWLQEYQKTKCEWAELELLLHQDSLKIQSKYATDLQKLNDTIGKLKLPYEQKITAIKVNEVENQENYLKLYHKATDIQSQKYGHVSTPAYEKQIAYYERKREEKTTINSIQIENLMRKEINVIANFESQKNEIQQKISNELQPILEKTKPQFNTLQIALDNLNRDFKMKVEKMKQKEQIKFYKQRDSIRANPCNFVIKWTEKNF